MTDHEGVLIRRALKTDRPGILQIIDSLWARDGLWGPVRPAAYEVDGPQTVLVAERDREIVAASSFRVHPHRPIGVLFVDVKPGWQRHGIGSALLREHRTEHEGIQYLVRARPWDEPAMSFYPRHGFRIAERVREGLLDPHDPAISPWIDSALATPAFSIEPFDMTHRELATIAMLIDNWYERLHTWTPSRRLTVAGAIATYLEPAIPGTMYVVRDRDRYLGAGVMISDPFGLHTDVGHLAYVAVADLEPEKERQVITELVASCLHGARDLGRTVQVEASDRQPVATSLLTKLAGDRLYEGLIVFVTDQPPTSPFRR